MKKIICILLLAAVFFGCSEDNSVSVTPQQQELPEEEEPNENEPVSVAFEEVARGSYDPGIFSTLPGGNYVINTDAEWTAYRQYPQSSMLVQTNIVPDFQNYTYIALRHDYHSHSHPDVKIGAQSVSRLDNTVTVNFIKQTSPEDSPVFTMPIQPYQLIRISKTTDQITFVQVQQ